MLIQELIQDESVNLENGTVEYKRKLNREKPENWLKTLAGFANADGGTFYLGVDDNKGTLIGYERDAADEERNYFVSQMNQRISPCPKLKIEFVPYVVRERNRFIIKIQVFESAAKPVLLKMDGFPAIFMRREGYTNGATYEEINSMSRSSGVKQYDCLYSDQPYNKNDFHDLQTFCQKYSGQDNLSDKALRSMGFFNQDGFLANGAVLFKDNYCEGKTLVHCSVFSGFTKGSDRIVTLDRFTGNLPLLIEHIWDFIKQRMNHSMVKQSRGRINIDAFPERAVFEGVVNAVAHRDYYLDGTQIQIDMFKDRLEITSPGSFYEGTLLGKTYDLSSIISKRRNELITNILVACNVMEAAGTGFDKIIEEYSKFDEKHRPFVCSYSDHFTLVLPDLTYMSGPGISEDSLSALPIMNPTMYDSKVLEFCYSEGKTLSQIAEYLGLSRSAYLRTKILENLVTQEYLIKSKHGNAAFYLTNRENVTLL